MDSIPIFVPNFPPPPIHSIYALPITSKPSSSVYKERLENYLQSRTNRPIPTSIATETHQKPLKLSELSMDISNVYGTIETIKTEIENLSRCAASLDNSQWDNQLLRLKSQLNELSTTNQKHQNPNLLNRAKRAVDRRLKKRSRIRKRKAEFDALKKCELKNRELKHQQIDQWLNKNAEKIRENQREIENKQRAEEVLAEVKTLKNDAAKYMQTFDSLKELYRVRNKDKATGDSNFKSEIEKLKKKWLDASEKYEREEERLRTYLNYSNNLEEWKGAVFGDEKNEDIFSLKKHENGLAKLIEIRRQWDSFIVPDENPYGSSVPLGWATPNANPTKQWAAHLKGNDQ